MDKNFIRAEFKPRSRNTLQLYRYSCHWNHTNALMRGALTHAYQNSVDPIDTVHPQPYLHKWTWPNAKWKCSIHALGSERGDMDVMVCLLKVRPGNDIFGVDDRSVTRSCQTSLFLLIPFFVKNKRMITFNYVKNKNVLVHHVEVMISLCTCIRTIWPWPLDLEITV